MSGRRSTAGESAKAEIKKEVSDTAPAYFQYLNTDKEPVKGDPETPRTFGLRRYYTKVVGGDITSGFMEYNRNTYGVKY